MKRAVLLVMSAILIAFTSCNQNEPTLQGTIDPQQSTTVTIYGANSVLKNVQIYNAKNKLVGVGTTVGSYWVPYNGSIAISYGRSGSYSKDNDIETEKFSVGTMKQMFIAIGYYSGNQYNPSYWYLSVTDGR